MCVWVGTNTDLIRQAINEFNWQWDFLNTNVNENVDIFSRTIRNILSNFIPHEFAVCDYKELPWFNKKIISLSKKKMLHLKIMVIIVVTLI